MKNFATLLQEKLGSRDTKTLALMRLGRQLAEWEPISEKLKKRSSLSLSLSTV
ncbi:hypothetical protein ACIP97_11270 [Peribacillus frigoritolerans]|uniref:hypothetical protein n=1 Tax=Peribacillus frigoritolerans TaxID=450367 RepID=UPI00382F118F